MLPIQFILFEILLIPKVISNASMNMYMGKRKRKIEMRTPKHVYYTRKTPPKKKKKHKLMSQIKDINELEKRK